MSSIICTEVHKPLNVVCSKPYGCQAKTITLQLQQKPAPLIKYYNLHSKESPQPTRPFELYPDRYTGWPEVHPFIQNIFECMHSENSFTSVYRFITQMVNPSFRLQLSVLFKRNGHAKAYIKQKKKVKILLTGDIFAINEFPQGLLELISTVKRWTFSQLHYQVALYALFYLLLDVYLARSGMMQLINATRSEHFNKSKQHNSTMFMLSPLLEDGTAVHIKQSPRKGHNKIHCLQRPQKKLPHQNTKRCNRRFLRPI